jgi:hypothetical protein
MVLAVILAAALAARPAAAEPAVAEAPAAAGWRTLFNGQDLDIPTYIRKNIQLDR